MSRRIGAFRRALTRAAIALGALGACGDARVVITDRPPDAAPWPSRRMHYAVPDGGFGLVTNSGSDGISLLDLAAGRTRATVGVGIEAVGNDGPHHLAVDPRAGRAYVALSYPPSLLGTGPHAGHGTATEPGWVQTLDLGDFREIARRQVDPNPGDIVTTPDGRYVIVTHFDLARAQAARAAGEPVTAMYSRLWVLDARDLSRLSSVPFCVAAHGVAISADGKTLYGACYGEDALGIVRLDGDLASPAITRVPVGPAPGAPTAPNYGPYSVLLSRDGRYALLGDLEGHDVRVFDIAARAFDPTHAVAAPGAVYFGAESPDERYFFFPTQGPDGVVRVRRADWTVDGVARVARSECLRPHEISVGPDGRYYLVCEGTHLDPSRVMVFDPSFASGSVLAPLGRFDVGVYPDRVVFLSAGAR